MLYDVSHTTRYDYSDPVTLCQNLVHLQPRPAPRQVCHSTRMTVRPEPRGVVQRDDYFGNPISLFTIQVSHKQLAINVKHRLEATPTPQIHFAGSTPWEAVRHVLANERTPANLDAVQFTFPSLFIPRSEELRQYAEPSFPPGRPFLEAVRHLTARIHADFKYDPKATSLATPISEVLKHRRGVCQDFAHLQIGCIRSLALPARYVSGYLRTHPAPGRPRMVGADASHAWISAYCPTMGWVDLDPTNNSVPSDEHLTLAWGRDYDDVSPVKGVILGGGSHVMTVSVDVLPV